MRKRPRTASASCSTRSCLHCVHEPDDGKGGKGGGPKDLQISTLQKQIADLQTSTATEKSARIAAEKRRREIERSNSLVQQLAKGGVVDPFMQELAVSYFDRRGYVPLGEDEETGLVWRGTDGVEVAFEEGVTSWLKTDEAKRFLPPSGAGGSGGRRPPSRGSATKEVRETTFEDVGNAVLGIMNPGLGIPSRE
jgi:hypothetical protein